MNKILNEIQIKLRDLQARSIQHGYKLVILSLICSSLHQYLKLPRQGEYTDVSRPIKKTSLYNVETLILTIAKENICIFLLKTRSSYKFKDLAFEMKFF